MNKQQLIDQVKTGHAEALKKKTELETALNDTLRQIIYFEGALAAFNELEKTNELSQENAEANSSPSATSSHSGQENENFEPAQAE